VTSSYLEGEKNELGEYGYNRDGKRGKLQIVIGLLADEEGEPLAVRVFEGNRNDSTTVVDQINIKVYAEFYRQLTDEVARVYADMVDAKTALLTSRTADGAE